MAWIDDLLTTQLPAHVVEHTIDLEGLRVWATRFPAVQAAWPHCPRGDWKLWLARRTATSEGEIAERAGAAALQAGSELDGNVHFEKVFACAAAAAACARAAPSCVDDAGTLALLVHNSYPVSAYAWARAHTVADPQHGKIPEAEHRALYERVDAAARNEARAALDAIINRSLP